jgi:pSer/pThr/pTyr-binding forkhead associated (FHA) protein
MTKKQTTDNLTVVSDGAEDTGPAGISARLRVVEGPDESQQYKLDRFRTVIGRRNADIVLNDPRVSRQHALIERYRDRILVKDLGSSNGTRVDGRSIEVEVLSSGSRIQVGDSVLEVFVEP